MGSDFDAGDELKDLLREVVASNLTVAYQMEVLKRKLVPGEEKNHPFAQVLETFEMIREVLEPEPDDEEALDEDAELEVGEAKAPSAMLEGTPFESTLRYLRPRRKKPSEG